MTAPPVPGISHDHEDWKLLPVARFARLRALAWSGEFLYASRGYELLRAKLSQSKISSANLDWQPVAAFRPSWWRRGSAAVRLTSRLFRDGFHALAVLPTGTIVGAVPGAIVTLKPGETEFRPTHTITRGTRPLCVTTVRNGTVYWGEYFDNAARDEVHIYASTDEGITWNVAYTFSKSAIRHVHNIVYDAWADCLWVLTGDYGDECRILRASCDFTQVEVVLQGNQQVRAVALVPKEDGLYFATDTPLEKNFVYYMDRASTDRTSMSGRSELRQLAPITSSSICGCRVRDRVFFSTMVEPSAANPDRNVRVYGSHNGQDWNCLLAWRKDIWPMSLFQYGNAFFPSGENQTNYLAVTAVAVESDDQALLVYSLKRALSS